MNKRIRSRSRSNKKIRSRSNKRNRVKRRVSRRRNRTMGKRRIRSNKKIRSRSNKRTMKGGSTAMLNKFNMRLRTIALGRPHNEGLAERNNYKKNVFEPVFLEMVEAAMDMGDQSGGSGDLISFCKGLVNNPNLSGVQLQYAGLAEAGGDRDPTQRSIFVDEDNSILYKVSVLMVPVAGKSLSTIINEWYYSIIVSNGGFSPEALKIFISKWGGSIVFILSFRKHKVIPFSSDYQKKIRMIDTKPATEWTEILLKGIPKLKSGLNKLNVIHMDSHFGNVVYDEEKQRVLLIDWERCIELDTSFGIGTAEPGIFKWYEDKLRQKEVLNISDNQKIEISCTYSGQGNFPNINEDDLWVDLRNLEHPIKSQETPRSWVTTPITNGENVKLTIFKKNNKLYIVKIVRRGGGGVCVGFNG